jgi:hypothetical protein
MNIVVKAQEIDGYKLIGLRDYRYNEKGEKVEKRIYDVDHNLLGFVCYKYDINSNKIETLKYSSDSILLVRYVYFNDAENFRIRNIKVDYERAIETRKTYFNNETGENIRTEYFDAEGLTKYSEMTYTDNGEYKRWKSFDKDGNMISDYAYQYVYENEKVIEKRRLSEDDLVSLTRYEYDKNGFKISYSSDYVSSRITNKKRLYQYNASGQCVSSLVYELIKKN